MDSDGANSERCHGRTGTYEAWFLTFAVPATRQGYWIRYTSFNPAAGIQADAHSALWAFRFDHENPGANWGAKESFPLSSLQVQNRPFALRLDDALLRDGGCSGEVNSERGRMAWDLRWDSREHPFPLAPALIGGQHRGSAGDQGLGQDRARWGGDPPRACAWRSTAHVGFQARAGMELGIRVGGRFLG